MEVNKSIDISIGIKNLKKFNEITDPKVKWWSIWCGMQDKSKSAVEVAMKPTNLSVKLDRTKLRCINRKYKTCK